MKIQILAPEVVDQIAAGEVVERPAHLVKELIENSLDAKATEIEVEFDHGGRFVRVSDNGEGIDKGELVLALSRHATSKIKKTLDIWSIHSFGFRGEALASLAAVSQLTMTSRTKNQETAFQIVSEFGKPSEVLAVGGEPGTTVLIEELFKNVPARLKFLKSDSAESTQIKNVLKALAMANPQVDFRIRHKGQLLFYWPKMENLKDRVEQVLEQESLFYAEGEYEGIKARAVISSPNHTMGNSRQLWFFAQNRWIQDRTLTASVMEAYRNLLMHGEYPIVAAWLECGPEEIDVNIHPTKSQVKFKNTSHAFRALNRTIRGTLEKAPWLSDLLPSENQELTQENPEIIPQNESFKSVDFDRTQFSKKSELSHYPSKNPFEKNQKVMESLKAYGTHTSDSPTKIDPVGDYKLDEENSRWSKLQVLGQANLTYIITQSAEAIVFVDQHAAHERVLFERLMKAWKGSEKTGGVETQAFLLPLSIQLEGEEAEALLTVKEELLRLGVEIDSMGPETISARSAPLILKDKALHKALSQLGREMVEKGGSFALERSIADVCATMACHSAVRAGQALSHQEMISLLVQMDEFPLSSFCPHGRPVYVEYSFNKLEKDFGRIV